MGTGKKNTSEKTSALKRGQAATIVYKTKVLKSSFPEKIKKANKLLSKAKLTK